MKKLILSTLAVGALIGSVLGASTTASREWVDNGYISKHHGGLICFNPGYDGGLNFTTNMEFTSVIFGRNTYGLLTDSAHFYCRSGSFFDWTAGSYARCLPGMRMWLAQPSDWHLYGDTWETGTPLPNFILDTVVDKIEEYDFTGKIKKVTEDYMLKGWAKYTAVNGISNEVPDSTWIDTGRTVFAAGKEWEKVLTISHNAYYILTCNNMTIQNGMSSEETGVTMTFSDSEGNDLLRLQNGQYYIITPEPKNFSLSNGTMRCVYHSEDKPDIMVARTMEKDDQFLSYQDEGCVANVTVEGVPANWQVSCVLKDEFTNSPSCFMYGKIVKKGTDSYVEVTVPLKISAGIEFPDGVMGFPMRVGDDVKWTFAECKVSSVKGRNYPTEGLGYKGIRLDISGNYLTYLDGLDTIKMFWGESGDMAVVKPASFSQTAMSFDLPAAVEALPLGTEVRMVFDLHAGIKTAPVQNLTKAFRLGEPVSIKAVNDGSVHSSSAIVKDSDIVVSGTNLWYGIAGDSVNGSYNTYREEVKNKFSLNEDTGEIVKTVTTNRIAVPHPIALTPKASGLNEMRFAWPTDWNALEVGEDISFTFTLHGNVAGVPATVISKSATIVNPVTVTKFAGATVPYSTKPVINPGVAFWVEGTNLSSNKADTATCFWETTIPPTEEGGEPHKTLHRLPLEFIWEDSTASKVFIGWPEDGYADIPNGPITIDLSLHGGADGCPSQDFEFEATASEE